VTAHPEATFSGDRFAAEFGINQQFEKSLFSNPP
jgi:hypothetical protein